MWLSSDLSITRHTCAQNMLRVYFNPGALSCRSIIRQFISMTSGLSSAGLCVTFHKYYWYIFCVAAHRGEIPRGAGSLQSPNFITRLCMQAELPRVTTTVLQNSQMFSFRCSTCAFINVSEKLSFVQSLQLHTGFLLLSACYSCFTVPSGSFHQCGFQLTHGCGGRSMKTADIAQQEQDVTKKVFELAIGLPFILLDWWRDEWKQVFINKDAWWSNKISER